MLSHAQDCSQQTLKISGIPENIDNGEIEGKVLTVLQKSHGDINPANVEACPCLESNNKGRKAILKRSRRKDSDKIRRERSKLKTTDQKFIGNTTPVYINDSLYFDYKRF